MPSKSKTRCPCRKFQGVTGFKALQPYCSLPSFCGLACPVIKMNTGEPIDCEHLDENQLAVMKKHKKENPCLY